MVKKDNMKTDKKIEEIMELVEVLAWGQFPRSQIFEKIAEVREELTDLLNTEVQRAVEEAVRGFVDYYERYEKNELKFAMSSIDRSKIETYLQTLNENYTPKDQVQAECEKYLDAFKEIMRESPTIGKHEFGRFWELLDKFKKEQREHE